MRLTSKQRRNLATVAAYQERYNGLRMWAGCQGTDQETLDELVGLGLMSALRSESGTRWWYGLTATGRALLEEADAGT